MHKAKLLGFYLSFDALAAIITWILLFIYRKYNIDHTVLSYFSTQISNDPKLYLGIIVLPVYWLLLHTFVGYYVKIQHKSRLKELEMTLLTTFLGTLLFFFIFILDDIVNDPFDYVKYFTVFFCLQFLLTYIPRLAITTNTIHKIKNGKIGFNTLIIGSNDVALQTYHNVIKEHPAKQKYILGYIKLEDEGDDKLIGLLPSLGNLNNLTSIVNDNNIEELIIAIQNGKRKYIEDIVTTLQDHSSIVLKIIPQTQDFLMGIVKTSSVLQEPLISIFPEHLPIWQQYLKRIFDICISLIAIIILFPLYLFLMIGVKCSSKGSVFYTQERIGLKGKPFKIIKFRSMIADAETGEPQLSSKTDTRITPFGRFMRRSRFDEIPQFFNVLIGDMSLVGPRPERQYYIDQLVKRVPYYKLLLSVKPGMTSWGQVRFGYAENIDEMVDRLKWDLLYLENMSLQMDIKILIYTALIVLKRTGK